MAKVPASKLKKPAKPEAGYTVEDVLHRLEAMSDASVKAQNAKTGPMGRGAGSNQFGVKRGDIRKLADAIKTDHELAMALWKTGNLDARFLATLILEVDRLSANDLEKLVKSVSYAWLADWLYSYVVKLHPEKETLRQKWMRTADCWLARAGWQLTAGRVAKAAEGLDLEALLDRIEKELLDAVLEQQWTMNMCLAEIGINHPKLRQRAVAIGEKLGVYRDYPVSKGCTSPFAPIWIDHMVKRKK